MNVLIMGHLSDRPHLLRVPSSPSNPRPSFSYWFDSSDYPSYFPGSSSSSSKCSSFTCMDIEICTRTRKVYKINVEN